MKTLLPLFILLLVGLSCVAPSEVRKSDSTAKEPPPFRPTIEYSRLRWSNEADAYWLLSYQVKNTSDRPLEYLKATASFYDKKGDFIRSEFMYIDRYDNLPPGQISPAKLQTGYDPQIKSATITFEARGERSFEMVDVVATEVAKVKP